MKHTFLLQPGEWQAKGTFIGQNGISTPLTSKTVVEHLTDKWTINGYMRVLYEEPVEFQNSYEIVPIPKDKDHTTWKSVNPALGELIGNFIIVQDSILSIHSTKDNKFSGIEFMTQLKEYKYLIRGTLMQGDQKISSWAVELTRA